MQVIGPHLRMFVRLVSLGRSGGEGEEVLLFDFF